MHLHVVSARFNFKSHIRITLALRLSKLKTRLNVFLLTQTSNQPSFTCRFLTELLLEICSVALLLISPPTHSLQQTIKKAQVVHPDGIHHQKLSMKTYVLRVSIIVFNLPYLSDYKNA